MFDFKKLITLAILCCSAVAIAQSAPGSPTADAPANPVGKRAKTRTPITLRDTYYSFIMDKTSDHEFIQKEIRDDPEHYAPDVELHYMSSYIGIRPEDYQTILTYILAAHDRIKENEREYIAAGNKFQHDNGGVIASTKIPESPEIIALRKEGGTIIDELIANLKLELGDESFKKLDAYVHLHWSNNPSILPQTKSADKPTSVAPVQTQAAGP